MYHTERNVQLQFVKNPWRIGLLAPVSTKAWKGADRLPVDHLSEEFGVLLQATDDQGLTQLTAGVVAVLCMLLPHAADHAAHGLHHLLLCVCGAVKQQNPAIITTSFTDHLLLLLSTTFCSVYIGLSSGKTLPRTKVS